MTPKGEPRVISRISHSSCAKLYEGYTENESYSVYGEPCQIELRQEIKEIGSEPHSRPSP